MVFFAYAGFRHEIKPTYKEMHTQPKERNILFGTGRIKAHGHKNFRVLASFVLVLNIVQSECCMLERTFYWILSSTSITTKCTKLVL